MAVRAVQVFVWASLVSLSLAGVGLDVHSAGDATTTPAAGDATTTPATTTTENVAALGQVVQEVRKKKESLRGSSRDDDDDDEEADDLEADDVADMNEEEKSRLLEHMFEQVDTNKDGFADKNEMLAYGEEHDDPDAEEHLTPEGGAKLVNQYLTQYDLDKDGKLSKAESITLFKKEFFGMLKGEVVEESKGDEA
eukprot:TRINITY_DN8111_c0_g1_i1.p2 TRINITY_DN8111_c0_g1~~TRINITY_DN8111_c0_g1_i1.p2  ORF type:complete len:195 (-),score=60.61 TRINITY_DN8111_c0_g1_i1:70-654(-)